MTENQFGEALIGCALFVHYLKLGNFKLGYLLKFNTLHMRDGIVRLVNGLED